MSSKKSTKVKSGEVMVLQPGDVIALKKGMEVYANIPECFVIDNRRMSIETTEHNIAVGKKLLRPSLTKKKIEMIKIEVVNSFESEGVNISKTDVSKFVTSTLTKYAKETNLPKKYILEPGTFVVIKAQSEGSATCHGPNDIYPDGWKVTARRMSNGKITDEEISFYQSGSFSAMILPHEIKAIDHIKLKLTIK